MYSAVATALFAARNINKDAAAEPGRVYVAGPIQAMNAVGAALKLDNSVSKSATSATNVFQKIAKYNALTKGAEKVLTIASNNVNPILCVSGVAKVALSDDPIYQAPIEAGSLLAMFGSEKLMKDHVENMLKSDKAKNLVKEASEIKILKPLFAYIEKNKAGGKVASIAKGVIFFTGSILGYGAGHYVSKELTDEIYRKNHLKHAEQKDSHKELNKNIDK